MDREMNKSTFEDKNLVFLACQFVDRLGLEPRQAGSFDAWGFNNSLNIEFEALKKLGRARLGQIIGLALADRDRSLYRQTSVGQVTFRVPVFINAWYGAEADVLLVRLAKPVLVAAMYDVLATMRVHGMPDSRYVPNPAMARLVQRRYFPRRRRSPSMREMCTSFA